MSKPKWAQKMERMFTGHGEDLTGDDIIEMLDDLSVDQTTIQVVELTEEEAEELRKVFPYETPTIH